MARILIVEDELIIAADLQSKLRRLGHEVVGMAVDANEAIAVAERAKPDIVLMDVQLQGETNGIEAARIIYQRAAPRIVFVTAFPGTFVRDPTQMHESWSCLGKPFSQTQLEAALSAALADRQS
jgi:CheY-like chemotaxis protein